VIFRLVVGIVALVVLGAGCDSGSDDAEEAPAPPPSSASVDAVEACRAVYERLPEATRGTTTEDQFIEQCLAIVSGKPDPGLPPTT